MKADSRRRVQVEVDMMNRVESPEHRHAVRQDVPQVQRVVHEDNGGAHLEPEREPEPFHQPAPAPLDHRGGTHHDRCLRQIDGDRADGGNRQIAAGAPQPGLHRSPQRPSALEESRGSETFRRQRRRTATAGSGKRSSPDLPDCGTSRGYPVVFLRRSHEVTKENTVTKANTRVEYAIVTVNASLSHVRPSHDCQVA